MAKYPFQNIRKMKELDLSGCKLEGYRYARSIEVCMELSHYSNLANSLWSYPYDQPNLHCFLPPFATGAIPESLVNLEKLWTLTLSNNKLEGHFFLDFGMVSPVRPTWF